MVAGLLVQPHLVESISLALCVFELAIAHIFMTRSVPQPDSDQGCHADIVSLGLRVVVDLMCNMQANKVRVLCGQVGCRTYKIDFKALYI